MVKNLLVCVGLLLLLSGAHAQPPAEKSGGKDQEFVDKMIEEVANKRNVDKLGDFFADKVIIRKNIVPGDQERDNEVTVSLDDMKQHMTEFFRRFPSLTAHALDVTSEENRIYYTAVASFSGVMGGVQDLRSAILLHTCGGTGGGAGGKKICMVEVTRDFHGLLQQLVPGGMSHVIISKIRMLQGVTKFHRDVLLRDRKSLDQSGIALRDRLVAHLKTFFTKDFTAEGPLLPPKSETAKWTMEDYLTNAAGWSSCLSNYTRTINHVWHDQARHNHVAVCWTAKAKFTGKCPAPLNSFTPRQQDITLDGCTEVAADLYTGKIRSTKCMFDVDALKKQMA